MIVLEIYRYYDAADGNVGIVKGRIGYDSEAEKDSGCDEEKCGAQVRPYQGWRCRDAKG